MTGTTETWVKIPKYQLSVKSQEASASRQTEGRLRSSQEFSCEESSQRRKEVAESSKQRVIADRSTPTLSGDVGVSKMYGTKLVIDTQEHVRNT